MSSPFPEDWIITTAVTPTTRGCPGATPQTAAPAGSTVECPPAKIQQDRVKIIFYAL